MRMMRTLRMVLMLTPLAVLATADQAWGQFRTTGGSGIGRGNTGSSQFGGGQTGIQLGGNRGSAVGGGGGGNVFGTQTSISASVFGTQQAGNVGTTGTAGVDFMSEFRANPLGGSGIGNTSRVGGGIGTGTGYNTGFGNTGFGNTGFGNTGFGNTGFNTGGRNTGFGNTGLNRGGLNSLNSVNRGGLGAGLGGFNTLGGRGNQLGNALGFGNQGYNQGNTQGFGPGRNQRNTSIAPAYVMRVSPDIPIVAAHPEVVTRIQGVIANSPSISSAAKVQFDMNKNVLVLRGVVSSDHERAVIETMARLEPGVHSVRNELQISGE